MSSNQRLTIVTRTSPLAMWQANFIGQQLLQHHPQIQIQIRGIKTTADKLLETPLNKMGGKGIFVKELEEALINQEADLAVHSLKDVPAFLPEGLVISAVCKRENPQDVWVCPKGISFMTLPAGGKVGTSSLRRIVQLKKMRADLHYVPLRGNVDTRLKKCVQGEWDGIVLAQAGLMRLGLESAITSNFKISELLPAVGQGALGIECRKNDDKTRELVTILEHAPTRVCIEAERAMNRALGGNCQVPVAGYAVIENNQIQLRGMVGDLDSLVILSSQKSGLIEDPAALGEKLAEDLIAQGAKEIIQNVFKKI